MNIPGLGPVEKDEESGWYISQPITINALNQQACEFLVEGYDEAGETTRAAYHQAIDNFIKLQASALQAAQEAIFAYYQDTANFRRSEKADVVSIGSAADVWQHIQFGDEALVCRRQNDEQTVYVSLECECDWEEEQGLQIVFRHGAEISKLGPFDDFMSNADVFGEASLDKVIYQSRG